mmetsp:Transcript_7764/g.11316  ORF Transcript_7764/g.11316 Transcript_7764/m.11316 type:complete len:132 (+) Transcript_7764:97-492(+)|eukprot:CAMPEP_0195520652 /NCGR_PEP_ID=MMETSP0794_2-20130614/17380_1 /TAXON_ID=515487 /ORGANISM="Stephanopyxis turris, Strain CCMP 815" /LENGTH=131 /DNA_ID=CAMNT_0040650063 /DNA_START=96 /DNA_END=491 /DNA_ORIENTATION=+
MSDAKLKLSFDNECNIRVLDAEKYKGSEELKQECEKFNEKIDKFTELSHGIIEVIDKKADQIETLKLRAIGQRNQVEHEQDTRNRKKKQLLTIISDMKQALERYKKQHDSLLKVSQEQSALIEKLSQNEAK